MHAKNVSGIEKEMHVLLVIITAFSATFAFSFLFAGFVALIQVDTNEQAEVEQQLSDARKKGWMQEASRAYRWTHQDIRRPLRLVRNWQNRKQARRLIGLGTFFLLLASTAGYFTGSFS